MRAPHADTSFYFAPRPPQLPFALSVQGSEMTTARLDGGGRDRSTIVCGFLGLDARPFNPGSATVLVGKGTSRVALEPSGDSALAGSGSFQPAPDMKVVVSVTLPGQAPVQARFTPGEAAKPVGATPRK